MVGKRLGVEGPESTESAAGFGPRWGVLVRQRRILKTLFGMRLGAEGLVLGAHGSNLDLEC